MLTMREKLTCRAEGDYRRTLPRFKEDVGFRLMYQVLSGLTSRCQSMRHNFAIVDALTNIAKKRNTTAAQLCIAWVSSLGPHVIPIPGSSYVCPHVITCRISLL